MTEISAKTFGRKQWKIMHFSGVLQQFILKEKNIDYSAGDHPLGNIQVILIQQTRNSDLIKYTGTITNVNIFLAFDL